MDDDLRTTLTALGLRTAGALAALGAQDVERRWGAEGLTAWRLARGDDPRRATLARLDDPHVVAHDLPAPVLTTEPLLFVVRAALDRLVRALAADGRAVAAVALTLTLDGERPRRVTREVRPATPIARAAPLFERCRALLDAWPLDGPVCAVEVRIARVATAPVEQGDLLAPAWRDPAAAEAALARLRAAFGTTAVVRPVTRDSHAPERAGAWEAIETVAMPSPTDATRTHEPTSLPGSMLGSSTPEDAGPPSLVARRLLDPPETIAVTADAAGMPQEIRWRGDRLRIGRADGPERLSGAWWQPAPFARDHWRCVSTDGGTWLCYRDATGWWLQGWDD
jgi:protein ImuB